MEDPLAKPIPWPRLGDVAFGSGPDVRLECCVDFRRGDWNAYACGYKDAADMIVANAGDRGFSADFLVYPVAFLYRHYVELRLKTIVQLGVELKSITPPEGWRRGHNLKFLWRFAREALEKHWPQGPAADLDSVGNYIRELVELDSQSMAFRYPEDNSGQEFLSALTRVNLGRLSEVSGRIAALLDASAEVLGMENDFRNELAREASADWGG